MENSSHNQCFYSSIRKPLDKDDMLNLKIALETSQDVLEFVEDIHIFSDK